jgi:hypothetical protein
VTARVVQARTPTVHEFSRCRKSSTALRQESPSDSSQSWRSSDVVEHEAKEAGIVGTPQHLELRATRSRALMTKLKNWLESQHGLHPPKSTMAVAVAYALKNWEPLTRFLGDARIPPDNNRSEAALRAIALGRKNYLSVGNGNEDAGDNIAGLYSLVATCEATASIRSRISEMCSFVSARIEPPASTNCCPIAGPRDRNHSCVNHVVGRTVTGSGVSAPTLGGANRSRLRIQFQLRSPSERESDVCCKPDLSGASGRV